MLPKEALLLHPYHPFRLTEKASKDLSGKTKVLPGINRRRQSVAPPGGKQDGKERLAALAQQPGFKNTMVLFNEMLAGRLHDLPPKPPSEVRIFLSSTFTDMKVERNWLFTEAYPRLKHYCAGLGLDFSMLDMRWGVTEDATNEHITEILCIKEVRNCQRNSIGPNFVAFLGNKYGYRPLPALISREEFELLMQEAELMGHPDIYLLQNWYRLDTNSVPHVYTLTPIKNYIPHFGDYSNDEKRQEAGREWRQTQQRLQAILRQAALAAEAKSLMRSKIKHHYFRSVTECEIAEGILESEDPQAHTLCYIRNMEGLNNDVAHEKNAQRFMDCVEQDGKVVEEVEVKNMLNTLCSTTIPQVLGTCNIRHYSIPWRDGGTGASHEEHAAYLNQLSDAFVEDLQALILKGLQAKSRIIPQTEYYTNYEELLHHLRFTVEKCETFRGQQTMLDSIRQKLEGATSSHLIIVAESGVGKTSLIAMTMKMIPEWFGDCIRVVRYLGTSTESSDILSVLRNVAGQLTDAANMLVEPDNMKSMTRIVKYLPRLIRNVARKIKGRIFILLDSIDQLKNTDGAYSMKWLPTELPRNVTIVMSILTKRYGIADNLKTLLPKEEHYLHIDSLPSSTGTEIMDIILKKNKRSLTEEQRNLIVPEMEKFPNALYMKLLIDRSLTWSSYTPLSDIQIASTVKEAISMLFNDMENRFGKILISRTMGYLTEGLSGLTEVELEDALSCDDDVLDEVFQYHDPPVEGVVRIPALLWSRVKELISRYLTEKLSAGKNTLSWYHRQFHETATERYCRAEAETLLHGRLVQLYRATNGIKRDIFLSKRNKHVQNADRQVAKQPMTAANVRMLECVPYHCMKSGNRDIQKEAALCNFDFIKLRITANGLYTLLADFARCLKTPDEELETVQTCLRSLKKISSIQKTLPTELLIRLDGDNTKPHIQRLIQETRAYLESCENFVIPEFATEGKLLSFRQEGCKRIVSVHKHEPEVVVQMVTHNLEEVILDLVQLAISPENPNSRFTEKIKPSTWASTGTYKFQAATDVAANDRETYMVTIHNHRSLTLWDVSKKTCIRSEIEMQNIRHASGPIWLSNSECAVWIESQKKANFLLLLNIGKQQVEKKELPWKPDITTSSCTQEFIFVENVAHDQSSPTLAVISVSKGTFKDIDLVSLEKNGRQSWCHSEDVLATFQNKTVTRIVLRTQDSSSTGIEHDVMAMALSHDGEILAASAADGMLVLLRLHDGDVLGHTQMEPFIQIFFSNGMNELITLNQSNQLCAWTWLHLNHRCKKKAALEEKDNSLRYCHDIEDICFTDDYIMTVGAGMLKVWDITTMALFNTQSVSLVSKCCVTKNGKVLLTDMTGHLFLYDIESKDLTSVFEAPEESVESFDLSNISCKCYALVKSSVGFRIDVINMENGVASSCQLSNKIALRQPRVQLTKTEKYLVISHVCSESEKFAIQKQEKTQNLYISQGTQRLYAWDVTTASPTLKVCNRQLTNVPCLVESWLPTADDMVIIGRSRVTIFWNVESGKNDQKIGPNKIPMAYRPYWIEGPAEERQLCHGVMSCIAMSDNGQVLATGSDDGWLMVYDTATGHSSQKSLLGAKPHHHTPITRLAVSARGTYVASLGTDNTLKIFSQLLKGELLSESKLRGEVKKMAFNKTEDKLMVLISRGMALTRLLILKLKSGK